MSKYDPLKQFLSDQTTDRLRLTFQEVERVLGFQLPASARRFAPWWANDKSAHVQADAWMAAGWRTCQVDVPGEAVSFERTGAVAGHQHRGAAPNVASVEEPGVAFLPRDLTIDTSRLSLAALKLLQDYTQDAGGDAAQAAARALHEAAVARRRALIERFSATAPRVPDDSTDLIRAERDAR